MVVVDTNVVACLLIEGERTAEAQALYARDPDWRSESFLLVEFSNMLATYVRNGRLDSEAAAGLLAGAERILTGPWLRPRPQRAPEFTGSGPRSGPAILRRPPRRQRPPVPNVTTSGVK